jgi:class 3 adenylate cyclase
MNTPAPERVERRLTAILAADVVGYSRLMGEDEEGTLAALKAIRRELVDPRQKSAFPAKAGIHPSASTAVDEWVQAFAGNAVQEMG